MQPNSKQLAAKNYSGVIVQIRDIEKPIAMAASTGLRLMDYLTNGNAASHVQITSKAGDVIVVKITDILKVEPVEQMKELKDYA